MRKESPLSGNRAQYRAGTQEASVPPAYRGRTGSSGPSFQSFKQPWFPGWETVTNGPSQAKGLPAIYSTFCSQLKGRFHLQGPARDCLLL